MRQNYDVTVIGAGPGGSAAAQVVAQGNWRVLLLERDEYPGARNVCGGGLEPQDVEIVGVDDRLVQKVIHRREHIFPWGMVVRQREHITVLRRELDRALAGRAVEAGADLADIGGLPVLDEIARAKYIPEDQLDRFERIAEHVTEQLTQLTPGGRQGLSGAPAPAAEDAQQAGSGTP